jgi:hypothetical protein
MRLSPRLNHFSPLNVADPGNRALAALGTLLLGYACIGFLLAMPSARHTAGLLPWAFGGILAQIWGVGLASTLGNTRRPFIVALVGSTLVTAVVASVIDVRGDKAASATVISMLTWGITWATLVTDELAGPLLMVFGWTAVIAWLSNAGILIAGLVFTFMATALPALGDRLGRGLHPSMVLLLTGLACSLGLSLGWFAQHHLI